MTHAYTEDQLVEQPAIGQFDALGWQTISALEETLGPSPPAQLPEGEGRTWLGRETKGEVVLVDRLRAALTKLNSGLPAEAIQSAIDELARDRSAHPLVDKDNVALAGHGALRFVVESGFSFRLHERLCSVCRLHNERLPT